MVFLTIYNMFLLVPHGWEDKNTAVGTIFSSAKFCIPNLIFPHIYIPENAVCTQPIPCLISI